MKPITQKNGRFYISGTAVYPDPVFNRFVKGESVEQLAKWFKLSPSQIEDAIRFRSVKNNAEAMEFVQVGRTDNGVI